MRIYVETLGRSFKIDSLKPDAFTPHGIKLWIIQQAYATHDGVYKACAIDLDGDLYHVIWETVKNDCGEIVIGDFSDYATRALWHADGWWMSQINWKAPFKQ